KKSGFNEIDLEIIAAHSVVVGDDIFQKSEGSGIPAKLVEDGYLPREIMDRIANQWFEMLQQENHAIFRQLFIAGGKKIAEENKSSLRAVPSDETSPKDVLSEDIAIAENKKEPQTKQTISSFPSANGEDKLTSLWCQVLGLPKIDIHDNFFDLGGNSLLAVRLVNQIKKSFDIDISVTELFQYPTVSSLAKNLGKNPDTQLQVSNIEDRAKNRRKAIMQRRQKAFDKNGNHN
ncbi:MAG: phosphopantetheine-binding protein, partial [Deltaproteobacteria bacterium]